MEKENEINIEEKDLTEVDFTPEELEAEDVDWKAKAQELKGIAKRRATQLGKAKAKLSDFEKQVSELKPKEAPPQDKNTQSNEPDYAKLAFLEQRGVKHPDDIKIVQDEANRLKLPLTDVLNMGHIKSRLEANNDERTAKAGMPKGGTTGGKNSQDVDYWLAKGETPKGNQELAEKVIEARLQKEKSQNKFSDELYNE